MSTVADLTKEDTDRINDCDFYAHAKNIMKSFEEYSHVSVGEVYSIIYRNHADKTTYVSRGKNKDKYLVIHKDEGFIFAKRIKSDGKLSKNVVCLTIRFPQPTYSIELDSEQAEAIIFQDENGFDPFKEGRDLSKKKNKARRLNNQKVITYNTVAEAFAFISTLKYGDTLYDAGTHFGEGIVEWKVTLVQKRPVDKTPQRDYRGVVHGYGRTSCDQRHNHSQLEECVLITLETVGEIPQSRKWISKTKEIYFSEFLSERYRNWYSSKPVSIEEV